jgi:hypothetical protein
VLHVYHGGLPEAASFPYNQVKRYPLSMKGPSQ